MSEAANWFLHLDEDDREQAVMEVFDAVRDLCLRRDVAPLETWRREWRATAEALADPDVRAALTGPLTGDFTEVPRP